MTRDRLAAAKGSGVHRKLGAHITKVLSLTIDTWSIAQVEHMETLGNAAVNAEVRARRRRNPRRAELTSRNKLGRNPCGTRDGRPRWAKPTTLSSDV